MASAYFLEGSDDEFLLVVRSFDKQTMIKVIEAIKIYRDKELDNIAEQLEDDLYDRHARPASKTRPKNKKAGPTSPKRSSK